MKVSVDRDRCEAHGMCEATLPEFFTLDEEGYSSIGQRKPVPPELENAVRTAVQACPMSALTLDED